MKSIIIANITWNPFHWRSIYHNPHAGHRYTRDKPGHESLNFQFDKLIDKNGKIYGHVQWTNPPKKFSDGGMIIFYSRNLDTKMGEIVGVYGSVKILRPPMETPYPGFENDNLVSSVEAEEKYSMLFPIPLNAEKYKKILGAKRLGPQSGFNLINNIEVAKQIIGDEINVLERSGILLLEKQKLKAIYEFMTGELFTSEEEYINEDFKEQDELLRMLLKNEDLQKEKLIQELKNLKPTDPVLVKIGGKSYKRDTKTILSLKILRGFKCQLCSKQILKADGNFYIEAAHIIPKRHKGPETPENILILCPNHHKEFDFGNKKISLHNKMIIKFQLNGNDYSTNLDF